MFFDFIQSSKTEEKNNSIIHYVPKCMSCHKATVVITGGAHCFHDCIPKKKSIKWIYKQINNTNNNNNNSFNSNNQNNNFSNSVKRNLVLQKLFFQIVLKVGLSLSKKLILFASMEGLEIWWKILFTSC